MKSAYELAMERLEKAQPSGPSLSDEQKKEIAEIENKYQSKLAEVKILADKETSENMGNYEAIQKIQERLQNDLRRLEEEKEEKKQAIRNQKPS